MSRWPSTRSCTRWRRPSVSWSSSGLLVLGRLLLDRDRGDDGGRDEEGRGVDERDRPAAEPGEERGAEQRAEEPVGLLDRLDAGVGVDEHPLGHQLLEQAVEAGGQDHEADAVEPGDRPDDPDVAGVADQQQRQHGDGRQEVAPHQHRLAPDPVEPDADERREDRRDAHEEEREAAIALEPVRVFTQMLSTSSMIESPSIDVDRPAKSRRKPGWAKAALIAHLHGRAPRDDLAQPGALGALAGAEAVGVRAGDLAAAGRSGRPARSGVSHATCWVSPALSRQPGSLALARA